MPKEYVRLLEGVHRIGETRVSLDSLVYLFREGMSAESMVECYPALTLDAYLIEGHHTAETLHAQSKQTNAKLIAKQRARHASQIPG
jgi:hypothetical protein